MMRFLSALVMGVALALQPASAQTQEPSVAAVQSVLQDMAHWMLEYGEVLEQGGQLMDNLDEFVLILEQFDAGDLTERAALTRLERWRRENRTELEAVRAAERRLRRPPSIALFGAESAPLEFAMNTARDNLLPVIDEIGSVLETSASMGVEALRNGTGKTLEVRQRAFYQSSIQLVRIDLRRVEIQGAALEPNHPNRPLMLATQSFYAALMAMPTYEIAVLDEANPSRSDLARSLRQYAREIRTRSAESGESALQMREMMRWGQTNELAPMMQMIIRMMDTFPDTVRAYNGLADGVDAAAVCVEGSRDTLDCWGIMDERTRGALEEIGRLERIRAEIVAANQHAPL